MQSHMLRGHHETVRDPCAKVTDLTLGIPDPTTSARLSPSAESYRLQYPTKAYLKDYFEGTLYLRGCLESSLTRTGLGNRW